MPVANDLTGGPRFGAGRAPPKGEAVRHLLKSLNPLRWTPSLWASLKPFGIGEQRPNNFMEIARAVWENRSRIRYAWRILDRGVCDGCALGTMGMKDWTMDGIHLCNIRLRLLRLNTMGPLDGGQLADVSQLEGRKASELRALGRLPYPMVRRRGEPGFRRVHWDEALDLVAERIRRSHPGRFGFYLTSRRIPNESYYGVQKAVRAMGTNSVDNAARVCHSPSTGTLKKALGAGASTCSYRDWIGSDLVVFAGSNVANNQPVATKYLHYAKKAGTQVAVINSYREPGMERYWIPSVPESALFGTKLADRFFLINMGGDIAFINGTIKHMIENGWVDEPFIAEHTADFDALQGELARQSWEELERLAGVSREEMKAFAEMLAEAETAVFVWSMGVTQHATGEDNVRAIINLALTKGFVGRDRCGLMPIRGHSGVQGGAEMGCYSTVLPGGHPINEENARRLSEMYGFDIAAERGLTAPEMIDAAYGDELDVLFACGGDFLRVMPDPEYVRRALERVPLRVHMDIVLSPQMLVDPADTVVLLPATTRYEIPGGVTQTSTERRVMFSPEIPGPRPGEVRPEWDVLLDLARRVRPDLADRLTFQGTAALRKEIAEVIPSYDGIQHLQKAGDAFQYGGSHLCRDWEFPTPDGRAHFHPLELPERELPEDAFLVSTRRGKQFNSMVQEKQDHLTGAVREAVLINPIDAERLGVREGEPVILKNGQGRFRGRAAMAPVKPGNLQIHWPEGNVLVKRDRCSPEVDIPDYNAVVHLEKQSSQQEAPTAQPRRETV